MNDQDQLTPKDQSSFSKTFGTWLEFGVILMLACAIGILVATLWTNHGKNAKILQQISQAVQYNCNTTNVVDKLLNISTQDIKLNQKLGEYTKLEKAGILTPHDLKGIQAELIYFGKADAQLKQNTACLEISNPAAVVTTTVTTTSTPSG